jgi:hypothetical protein
MLSAKAFRWNTFVEYDVIIDDIDAKESVNVGTH